MEPFVGESCPLSRLKKVVFPAPLGPIIEVNFFSVICTETRSTATCPPNAIDKSFVSKIAANFLPPLQHDVLQRLKERPFRALEPDVVNYDKSA